MRKWIWISLGSGCVALVAVILGARPFVRGQILSQARERGVELELGRVELGFPTMTLRNVRATLQGVEGVRVDLHEVRVTAGLTSPRLRGFDVAGGSIALSGSPTELAERLEQFRARHRPDSAGGEATPTSVRRRELARDLALSWALGGGESLRISGLQYELVPGSPRRVGADLVRLSADGLSLSVAGGQVQFASQGDGLAEVSAAEARLRFSVGSTSESSTSESNTEQSAAEHSTAEKSTAEKSTAEDRAGSKGAGSAAASGTSGKQAEPPKDEGLKGLLQVKPQRVGELRALLALARGRLVPRLPEKMGIAKLFLEVDAPRDRISIGPSRLSVQRREGAIFAALSPGKRAKGTPLELEARFPLAADEPLTARMDGGPVSLSSLGVREGDFGLRSVASAFIGAETELELSADASLLSAKGTMFLENLSLDQPRIAEDLIAVPRLSVRGEAEMAVDGSRYRLLESEIRLNGSRFEGAFDIHKKDERVLLSAQLGAPLISCQQLANSAPRALLGRVADLEYQGTFSLTAGVEADTAALSKMQVHVDFQNGCRITRTPIALDPEQFRGRFSREVLGAGGIPMQLQFGPASEQWVSLERVSPFVEAALLVTEDGRFFGHDGFDVRAIESAIRDNTKAGRFVRGASTISMQLAKNLYLSREKTLSRKFQEAALTMLLEQSFEKRELLELYVNVIEFGPGIYGIGPAAAYYFGTTPDQLSAAQAFFLASILPAPGASYFDEQGNLSEARKKQVRYLLGVSHKRERLTDEQLEAAQKEELQFGVPAITTEEPIEDRGVHAVPSEEGRPLAFPSDETEKRLPVPDSGGSRRRRPAGGRSQELAP